MFSNSSIKCVLDKVKLFELILLLIEMKCFGIQKTGLSRSRLEYIFIFYFRWQNVTFAFPVACATYD